MKNAKRIVLVLALVAAVTLPIPVLAAPNNSNSAIPEKSGLYNEPGHPGIKVRVFVHGPKPTTLQALVCDLSDPDSSAVIPATGWHLPANVSYNLNPSSVPGSVGSGNLATIVSNGFNDWSSAAGGQVAFTRGSDTTVAKSAYDGKNVIAWGRTSGNALGVTYVRYNTATGVVVDVDTIINKRFNWSWSNSSVCANTTTYDAENIMNHELGHWMGLDDVYTDEFVHNTMYGYGAKGEVKKNTLTTGDIAGIQAIY